MLMSRMMFYCSHKQEQLEFELFQHCSEMIYSLIMQESRAISKRPGHFTQVKRDSFNDIPLTIIEKCIESVLWSASLHRGK